MGNLAGSSGDVPDVVADRGNRVVQTVVDVIGDRTTPFRLDVFKTRVYTSLSLPADAPEPGFTRYTEHLRQKLISNMFVSDQGLLVLLNQLACPHSLT